MHEALDTSYHHQADDFDGRLISSMGTQPAFLFSGSNGGTMG
jgi:hypothetical protein